ncbi:MAG: nicotinamide riboside transporter PnuC [Marinilabiliales bacterium]|nr:MAG: nicotinamide riboside transporter PnuC [Marinilabiliales bacterium]
MSFFEIFWQNILNTTWLEITAVLFGLLSVWFAKKENILVYPTGIVSVLIYVYICFFAKLYADMGINFFYFLMSVYGWYMWTRKDPGSERLKITRSSIPEQIFCILSGVLLFFLLSYILRNFTDSDVPWWDSLTTAIFIVAMWLMARKKIDNWTAWMAGNLISVPLYFYKGLVFTSFQYLVFLILAIAGYIEWDRKLRARARAVPA